MPLDELCGFGTRRNRKRRFLLVSKVLGKHVPVRPLEMAQTHLRLAHRLLGYATPLTLVALAETATGLGHGVFEKLLPLDWQDELLFLHTTRYRLDRPRLLHFDESHSHAPEHLLYRPAQPEGYIRLNATRTLVLVDDEISTGRTLVNLARGFRAALPRLERVVFACLTCWLSAERRAQVQDEVDLPVHFEQLLRGEFVFVPDPAFDPGEPPDVTGRDDCKDAVVSGHYGRLGLDGSLVLNLDRRVGELGLKSGQRVLVLGTGEFAHAPFRLALRLEELGFDVHFQSTTRSPALVGGDIKSAIDFVDNYGDGIPNYVYNVADKQYDRVVIGYETRPLPAEHRLPEMLSAVPVYF